jgi:4-amino-4-deoxy-L-arabinose transferase-like glycosyltransferase
MKPIKPTSFLKNNFDLLLLALIVAAFIIVASIRLGRAPVPETDEAYTLQVAYEMVNRGQLSLPMYCYLGGNIENVWHSYTPVYFVILSGFFKLAGWGILEGRWFNLLMAALTLLITHLIGRRLFNWKAGLAAVILLAGDQTFFERSRLLRNDFAAAAFAMLAFYLYEIAEDRKQGRYYVAAGLAAGAGVMCHTNILYMLGGIGLLMLLRNGWRVLTQKRFYQFTLPAFAVMAYEIIYDLLDYKNFVLQNREDRLHFGLFERWGIWHNFIGEGERYLRWYAGGAMFMNIPRTTLHLFQLLSLLALIYLTGFAIWRVKLGDAMSRPAVRLLIITIVAALFHALITSHKEIYYVTHLAPWFALCAGAMFSDGLDRIKLMRQSGKPRAQMISRIAMVAVALAIIAFSLQLARQNRRYIREVLNPELASFEETRNVLRSVVPEGVCPVAMKAPEMWLAFPEHDRCFATIEKRMMKNLDLDGKEYAILQRSAYHKNRRENTKEFDAKYPLLAELADTPYGTIRVYYTGSDQNILALAPKKYRFFGRKSGFVTDAQLAKAQLVWGSQMEIWPSVAPESRMTFDDHGASLQPGKPGESIDLWTVDLKPETIYQLSLEARTESGRWDLSLIDANTGRAVHQVSFTEQADAGVSESLFKTGSAARIRLAARSTGRKKTGPLRISRISISEIPKE